MSRATVANRHAQAACRMWSRWTWFVLGTWLLTAPVIPQAYDCESAIDGLHERYTINETVPAGTILLRTTKSYAQWSFTTTPEEVAGFLTLKSDEGTPPSYSLTLHRSLHIEEMKDKNGGSSTYVYSVHLVCLQPQDSIKRARRLSTNDDYGDDYGKENKNNLAYRPQFNTSEIEVYVKEGVRDIVVLMDWIRFVEYGIVTKHLRAFQFGDPKPLSLVVDKLSGKVTASTPVDYEGLPEGQKYIKAEVQVVDDWNTARKASLTIHVINVDDLPPKFTYEGCRTFCDFLSYTAELPKDFTGKLPSTLPAPIHAEDEDGLESKISYRFVTGVVAFRGYIDIDPDTGEVEIYKPIDRLATHPDNIVFFVVEAIEDTPNKFSMATILLIKVESRMSKTGNVAPLHIVATTVFGTVFVVASAIVCLIAAVCPRRLGGSRLQNSRVMSTQEEESAPEVNPELRYHYSTDEFGNTAL